MNISLSLQSDFLRSTFSPTRSILLGETVGVFNLKQRYSRKFTKRAINFALSLVVMASMAIVAVIYFPELYYRVFPADVAPVIALEEGSPLGGNFESGAVSESGSANTYLPPINENLPQGNWVVVPRIGVRTQLLETENAEEALSKGVWQVPGYGDPGDRLQPVILAAHRFGWDWWWQSDYWKYNSFYFLPDTEPGDTVEIIAGQRKWVYEIYGGEEGQEILDYQADLILYTCKFLNSPVRHFRYARLIDPTTNSQS